MRAKIRSIFAWASLLALAQHAEATSAQLCRAPLYAGLVTNRNSALGAATPADPWANSRAFFYPRGATLTRIRVVLPCWWSNGGENYSNGPITYQASIEYPAGTIDGTFTFGGSTSGSCNGNNVWSDWINLTTPIPNGAMAYFRAWENASAASTGILTGYPGTGYAAGGDGIEVSATSVASKTGGGAIAFTSGFAPIYPLAIIGMTNQPSVALDGDSRVTGILDTGDISGDVGELARSICPYYGCVNLGSPSELAQRVGNASGATPYEFTNRENLAPIITDDVDEWGINDVNTSVALATIEANQQLIWTTAVFPNAKHFQVTQPPFTASTDGWTTATNQSALNANFSPLGSGSVWGQLNSWELMPHTGLVQTFPLANTVQPAANDGLWIYSGGPYTTDGKHESRNAALIEKNSGVIPPSAFHF